ncbi:type IV toxin-antitoxin system AbiEi family antitoxin domain-containing protein, partial [Candidatus Saccharibacteria bacterium]|nr:type IV toxin-antitoxin system AbiEi family antitoxin domain-containing protein [Candidatus Saccharibacteria bacterium]
MKNTGLTLRDSRLLEDAIIAYGDVASFDQLVALSGMEREYARKRISQLAAQGWLVRIKKGLYALSDISSRGFLRLSQYVVAQLLVEDSYVSFEAALQYHGMYDQLLQTIRSVARQQYKTAGVGGSTYRYIKTSETYFYGWETVVIEGRQVKMARAEKALLDLLMFDRTVYVTDLVLEILRDQHQSLDWQRLQEYLARSTTTVQRICGFLFDLAGIDSTTVAALVSGAKGSSRITKQSTIYSHKWRLYYDAHFTQYNTE